MKKVIALLLILLMLVGCGKTTGEDKRFVTIEKEWDYRIVADSETGVMYTVSNGVYNRGTFTLLVDKDGNPLIWDGH